MVKLPELFIKRMKQQLGHEADAFFESLNQPSPTSIRLHHKKGRSSFKNLESVPWCENGFYLETRPGFHLDPHWHGGAYYVQEASSMILDYIIEELKLDDKPRIWLDMCAAPGGKTGILAKHIGPSDILVANEVVQQRKTILWENLVKGGFINTMITNEQPSSFREAIADIILIDAPCAGEGMMRKEPEAIHQWSPGLVENCSVVQQQIVKNAFTALNPGGYLIYSTCSYSNEENINNISQFNQDYELESVPIHFPETWGITKMEFKEAIGYQLYPHKVKGEGLFVSVLFKQSKNESSKSYSKKQSKEFISVPSMLEIALNNPSLWKMRKNDEKNSLISIRAEEKANEFLQKFPNAEIIANAGQIKGKDFIPSHFLAMSGIQNEVFKSVYVDLNSALDFLERSTQISSSGKENGWYTVKYEDTCLGWMKLTTQGWKNHYPLNWRLRSRKSE